MQTWVVLLRGINVGGKNIVPMAQLRRQLTDAGFENVRSYIQSGNLVLQSKSKSSKTVSRKVAKCLNDNYDFEPFVLSITQQQLSTALELNPFPQAEEDPKSTHLYFLSSASKIAAEDRIAELAAVSERFELTEAVFYLYAPDGIARSKLAVQVEKLLGVPATARNYRTASTLLELTQS